MSFGAFFEGVREDKRERNLPYVNIPNFHGQKLQIPSFEEKTLPEKEIWEETALPNKPATQKPVFDEAFWSGK